MLEKIGNLTRNGQYRIVCKTAMKPLIQHTCSVEDFVYDLPVEESTGDIVDVFVCEDVVKVVNVKRCILSVWEYNTGHVVSDDLKGEEQ